MQESKINEAFQKGTTTVGIVCKDGVVLAADKRATAGYEIGNKRTEKVVNVSDFMAITTAGLVSDIQLMTKLIKAEIKLKEVRSHKEVSVKEVANLFGGILYSSIRRFSTVPSIVVFLLGGHDRNGNSLYQLDLDGTVFQIEDFVSTGSGSTYALGVLETLYNNNMTTKEGVELAKKAINAAIQRNVATGDGIDVFVIDDKGARKVFTKKSDSSIL